MLGKGRIAAALTTALVAVGFAVPAPAHAAVGRAELALRWAPIHYQDVDATGSHALGGRSDYITKVDYDGDLNGRNNWDRAGNTDLTPARFTWKVEREFVWLYLAVYMRGEQLAEWIYLPTVMKRRGS